MMFLADDHQDLNFDAGILWTVLIVLLIICALVWLFRNLR